MVWLDFLLSICGHPTPRPRSHICILLTKFLQEYNYTFNHSRPNGAVAMDPSIFTVPIRPISNLNAKTLFLENMPIIAGVPEN